MSIIPYLLSVIQYLYQQNCWLINFICKYIPLKQWAFDDSHSPKYQKLKTDELPKIQIHHNDWDWQFLIPYFEYYLYRNNGKKGQIKCKVCNTNFSPDENRLSKQYTLHCPHCDSTLVHTKDWKHFIIHKCVNPKCLYYLHNLKNVDKEHLEKDYGKNEYKLHYIYREFTIEFFKMDLDSLPQKCLIPEIQQV